MPTLIAQADAAALPLADEAVDLVVGSPPYIDARTYDDGTLPDGHTVSRHTVDWVEWMLTVTAEAVRVCRGPVVWVAAAGERNHCYQPAVEGLVWRWWSEGWTHNGPGTAASGHCRRPVYWKRVGIPGSGGSQWFRADVEHCIAFSRPGRLPWSDNTAFGHAPKWGPGGEMSHRLTDGTRVDQWGGTPSGYRERTRSGKRRAATGRPSRVVAPVKGRTKRLSNGEMAEQLYTAPALANPGNLLNVKVGGGAMGSPIAHENEAPYPEGVPDFFIRSLCPPDGTVLDPFGGSGTTAAVATKAGRRAITFDLRSSQCELIRRRCSELQPSLF